MSLFAGPDRTDYQDLLRALGRALDQHGWRDLRLVEDDSGLVLQGRLADALALLREAYHRRGSGALSRPAQAAPGPPRLPSLAAHGYAGVLGAAARWLDGAGWRMVRVVERREALVVQGSPRGWVRRGFTTHFLLEGDLRALLGGRSGGVPPGTHAKLRGPGGRLARPQCWPSPRRGTHLPRSFVALVSCGGVGRGAEGTVTTQQSADGWRHRLGGVTAAEEHEFMAALVRQLIAECRARLAAEDALRELVRDEQAVAGGAVERPAAA